jgi:hypothetical protein
VVKDNVQLADWVLARHQDLAAERAPYDTHWQELAEYFLPRKAEISSKRSVPDSSRHDVLFDTSGVQAAATLANGQLAYITPADSRWFVYEPPKGVNSDKAKQWYSRCSEATQLLLATSNVYTELHELYYDDSVFGTYCMFVESGVSHPVIFHKFDIGTYSLAEDDEGLVNTVFRELELTVLQAADKFGEDNLADAMKKRLADIRRTGKGGTVKHKFVHALYKRTEAEREQGKEDGPNKPWASVYVDQTNKHVCRNSGYDEKPFFAGRHVKSQQGVYGVSPAWMALPECRQLNFLSKQLDALAEIKAFPRLLMPATHEGEVDLRSGGVTYYDPTQPNALPQEWAQGGEYQIGLERENRKTEAINQAMHVDMFRMFASLERANMTATEVAERASEKLVQFSPSFTRKTTELLSPMLRGVFGILIRNGHFPPPPPDAILMDEMGQPIIPEPEVSYVSKVALAIRAMQNLSLSRTMERNAIIAQVRPEVLDNFKWDVISRETARNDGLPADWLAEEDEVEQARAARAEAQAKMAQQQEMLTMAEAAGKAGSVKQDSALGKLFNQASGV